MHHVVPRTTRLRAAMVGLVLLAACGSEPSDTAGSPGPTAHPPVPLAEPAAPPPARDITVDQVSSATIGGIFALPFTLANGSYESAAADLNAASSDMAVLMTALVRLGELDTQPGVDAAAVVASNGGGTSERITLSIVSLREGRPTSIGTVKVGDRTRIRDLRVAGPDIEMDMVEVGPKERPCCGTRLATRTYRLEGPALVEVASRMTGTLSLATTVAGHTWTLVAFDGSPIEPGATAPTLLFAAGRISGTSGCNRYTAAISESTPGQIRVGPPAGTRRACPGPSDAIETRFLKTLEKATGYTFLGGRLLLSGLDGEQRLSMTFSR